MRQVTIIVVLFITNKQIILAQKIEFYGGVNKNIFFDYYNNDIFNISNYKSAYDFSTGFALDSIKIDWIKYRFTIQFDNYKGKLDASSEAHGGKNRTIADIKKSVITLGIFPLNWTIAKRIDINFGFIISRLLSETFDGTNSGWIINQTSWDNILKDKYNRYSSNTYFGIQLRLAYDFRLSKSIIISPQYMYYFGLSNEFIEFPKETKSMRHYFCIGIEKKIK